MNKAAKRIVMLSLAVVSCSAGACFDYSKNAGVVTVKSREVCLEIGNPSLREGARVDLVVMGARQSHVGAKVVRKRDTPCSAVPAGDSYMLRIAGSRPDSPFVAIAVTGSKAAITAREGVVTGDLDGDGVPESFKSCASNEGLHLTIWTGKPVTGKRRFHAYHYAGYDLEPDCSAAEMAGTSE